MSTILRLDNVSVVFGPAPEHALHLADEGGSRDEIETVTAHVLGAHDCTLDVEDGEFLVLAGPRGSGKSALLHAVNGMAPIVRGSVQIQADNGAMADVARLGAEGLRQLRHNQVAMVLGGDTLLPWRTVRENVGLGLELSGIGAAERTQRVDRVLSILRLGAVADHDTEALSAEMRYRVCLARALVTEAPILLFDNVFSSFAPSIRARLQDALLELHGDLKRTFIFASDTLAEAFRLGVRVAIMDDGRIVQCGTEQEIVSAPANRFAADHVAQTNPLAVMTARDVMLAGVGNARTLGPRYPAETPLAEVMEVLAGGARRIVVEEEGAVIGTVTADSIVARLSAGDDPRPKAADTDTSEEEDGEDSDPDAGFFDGLVRK